MKLRPRAGTCLISPLEEEYKGRIIIPETVKGRDMPHMGTVAFMNGARITKKGVKVLADFKPGDKVLFRKFSGLFVEHEGKRFVQVPFGDVMAILE